MKHMFTVMFLHARRKSNRFSYETRSAIVAQIWNYEQVLRDLIAVQVLHANGSAERNVPPSARRQHEELAWVILCSFLGYRIHAGAVDLETMWAEKKISGWMERGRQQRSMVHVDELCERWQARTPAMTAASVMAAPWPRYTIGQSAKQLLEQ